MTEKAFQDYYPSAVSHCYGCGRLNEHGLKIKSYWDGDESVCFFKPEEYHIAFQGFVYGGLMASVIDCHSIATAIAVSCRNTGISMESVPDFGFVTGSLKIDFKSPAPTGKPLELRSEVIKASDNKVSVETRLLVDGVLCARGVVDAIKVPYSLISEMAK